MRERGLFRFPKVLGALVALVAMPSTAQAFSVRVAASGEPTRWAVPLIGYYLQLAGSDNLTPEESQLGVRRGFESWRELACSAIDFQELGDVPDPSTTLLTQQVANGLNEVVWIEDDSWTLGAYTLGVTLPLHDGSTGFIYEADIVFNGYLTKWKLDSGNGTDLESVAVHEIGHMFGTQHNLGPYDFSQPPTMAPNIASFNRSRSLEPDDQMAACFLYPAQPPYTCEDDTECPKVVGRDLEGNEFYTGAFPCLAGDDGAKGCDVFATAITGMVNLGEVCTFPEACAEGFSCTPWAQPEQSQGLQVCTKPCIVGLEGGCPDGFACVPFPIQPSTGACYPDQDGPYEPGEGPLGCVGAAGCPVDSQCIKTPVDGDGDLRLCVATCTADGEKSCAADEVCHFFTPGDAVGACFKPEALEPEPEPERMPEPMLEATPETPTDLGPSAEGQAEVMAGGDLQTDVAGPDGASPEGASGAETGCAGSSDGAGLTWPLLALILCFISRRRAVTTYCRTRR